MLSRLCEDPGILCASCVCLSVWGWYTIVALHTLVPFTRFLLAALVWNTVVEVQISVVLKFKDKIGTFENSGIIIISSTL